MKIICNISLSIFLFLTAYTNSIAQETEQKPTYKKHSIIIETGGRSFLFGSLNYEYAITNKFSLGGGLGLLFFQGGEVSNQNEKGNYFDLNSSQLIYGNYFIGKSNHKLILTAGLTNHSTFTRVNYPSKTEIFNKNSPGFNGGIGYHVSGESVFFRAIIYGVRLPDTNGFFPNYIPWLGLSGGFKFNTKIKLD